VGIVGVDAAWYQGSPDWAKVRKQIAWGILKATEGTAYSHESWFRAEAPQARAAGLSTHAYHFGRKDGGGGQASYFVAVVEDVLGLAGVSLWLDLESYRLEPTNPNSSTEKMSDDQARDFAARVNTLAPGTVRGLYGQGKDVSRCLKYGEFSGWKSWMVNPVGKPFIEQVGYITVAGVRFDKDVLNGTISELEGGSMDVKWDDVKTAIADGTGWPKDRVKEFLMQASAVKDRADGDTTEPSDDDRAVGWNYLKGLEEKVTAELKEGDKLSLELADGQTVTFVVESVA
jgi:hypothetical protein